MSVAAIHDPTHAYRRDARKLRGRFAHRPGELYRSLRKLSDHQDLIRSFETPVQAPVTPTSEFACEVRDFLLSGLLTYSTRQNLLKSAERRSIPRFEANLIIAAVQHRVPHRKCPARFAALAGSRLTFVVWFVLAQLALILAVWAIAAR